MSGFGHELARRRAAAVLELLTKCADEGRPAPSNTELAAHLDIDRAKTATETVKRLERQGKISVARYGMTRIITIKATGKRTAGVPGRYIRSGGNPPIPADQKSQPQPTGPGPIFSKPDPVRIDREPCTYCGVRAEVGCKHSRQAPRITFVSVDFHRAEVSQL